MKEEHCAFAVLNANDRCIAICHYTAELNYEADCIGNTRAGEEDYMKAGREVQITGGRSIWT